MTLGIDTPGVEQKLQAVGFLAIEIGMELNIGGVRIQAVEHPIDGIALTFSSVLPRNCCFFQVFAPTSSTALQIAALIYKNCRLNFPNEEQSCRTHFKRLGMLVL